MSNDYSPKTIPDLMKHLRENHSIRIKDEHTRQILNYGYYHAYKGYRFFKKPSVIIPYTTFEQILAVIDYDNDLKAALYPEMMFLETALKNIVVVYIIEDLPSAGINMVMKKRMNDQPADEDLRRKRNHMKNNIYSAVQSRSQNNAVIEHFKNKDAEIPIWAIFEVISLGDFIAFLSCLNFRSRHHLLGKLKMQYDNDIECQLLSNILIILKDLRNALAHNNVIFDTRFRDKEICENVVDWLSVETGIENIDFNSITDYYILIAVVLKKIEYEEEKLSRFVNRMDNRFKTLSEKTNQEIYNKLTTDYLQDKLSGLKAYLKKHIR